MPQNVYYITLLILKCYYFISGFYWNSTSNTMNGHEWVRVLQKCLQCNTSTSGTWNRCGRGPDEKKKANWKGKCVSRARLLSPWLTFSLNSFFKIPNRHLPTFTYINDCNIFSQRCNSCHDYTISWNMKSNLWIEVLAVCSTYIMIKARYKRVNFLLIIRVRTALIL